MPEGRMIKKRISDSKKLGALKSDSARLLYTWLIPFLDVEGRYSADPELIKGHVFPKVKIMTPIKISNLLKELAGIGLIILYQSDDEQCLQFKKDLQKIKKDRESPSRFSAPTDKNIINSGVNQDNSGLDQEDVVPIKSNLIKSNLSKYDQDFESFWKVYPKKVAKKKAYKVWKRLSEEWKNLSIVAAENYQLECKYYQTDSHFIKHPTTFLNPDNELWKDYQDKFTPPKKQQSERDVGKSTKKTTPEQKKKDDVYLKARLVKRKALILLFSGNQERVNNALAKWHNEEGYKLKE